MSQVFDTIVIGGGQAGLAAGYYLKRNKLKFLIMEAGEQSAGSWPNYYESLKLFSPAKLSSLPGLTFPGEPNHYPTRDEVVQYLQQYSAKFQLPVQFKQKVERIWQEDQLFHISTGSGEHFVARSLINATGSFHYPYKPHIPGEETFEGDIIHSSQYRTPFPYDNKRVLVVGSGNSAVQIAIELAKNSRTSLAVRNQVKLARQRILGLDVHYWVRGIGFDTFPFWRLGKMVPIPAAVSDPGYYKSILNSGNPDQRSMFTSFYSNGVIWPDGTREPVDTVIFATGYRPHLTYLEPLGALDQEGRPQQTAGISQSVPGLYYVGLEGQRSFASATLRGVGPDAKFVIRKLIQFLNTKEAG